MNNRRQSIHSDLSSVLTRQNMPVGNTKKPKSKGKGKGKGKGKKKSKSSIRGSPLNLGGGRPTRKRKSPSKKTGRRKSASPKKPKKTTK